MDDRIEDYILRHSDEEGELLSRLNRETHVKLLRPRMLSGHLQGRILKMLCRMIKPRYVLELGTFTGYSALCMAEGIVPDGEIHTIEIDDEIEDFTRSYFEQSEYKERIRFYIGDAMHIVPSIDRVFDLVLLMQISGIMSNIMIWYLIRYVREVLFWPTILYGTVRLLPNLSREMHRQSVYFVLMK